MVVHNFHVKSVAVAPYETDSLRKSPFNKGGFAFELENQIPPNPPFPKGGTEFLQLVANDPLQDAGGRLLTASFPSRTQR